MMKKLLPLLFLIPNLAIGETWVCSYIFDDEIETNIYKRINDTEFISENDFLEKIVNEDDESITLTLSRGNIGFSSTILDKEHKRFVSTVTSTTVQGEDSTKNYNSLTWEGDCEVIEWKNY